jgi:DNA-binding SARP family transcriptional activator
VEYRLLGPLEVVDHGRTISVGGGKRRALLALLLLHANEVISAERLIDELWGEQPPATVGKSLHVYVSQLRKELGPANGHNGGVLLTRGNGYVVQVGPDELDVQRAERLLDEGHRALDAGDPDKASAKLGQAAAMWRGPPLADFAYEPFAQREIARLDELRVVIVETRIEADLELGRHAALVGELEALVDENPLRERLRAQLMLALYRCGRQAEALEVYRDGRSRLVNELGLEPGPTLRELEAKILEHSPDLAPPAAPPRRRRREAPAPPPAAAPALRRRRLRPRVALPIVGGAVLLAASLFAALSDHGRRVRATPPPALDLAANSIAAIDPASGRAALAMPLPGRPTGLAAERDTVWAVTVNSSALVGIDTGTRSITRTVPLRMTPAAVAIGEGAVWVADGRRGELARIEPGYETVSARIPLHRSSRSDGGGNRSSLAATSVAVGEGGVWVTDGSPRLARVDPATRQVTSLDAGRPLRDVAAGAGAVWAISASPPSLVRVDPATGKVTDRLAIVAREGEEAPSPVSVAVGDDAVWVLNGNTATVTRVDPETRGVTDTVAIGVDRVPNTIATAGRRVWVANDDGTLSRLDPGAQEPTSVWVGESLRQVAVAGNRLWVATTAIDQQLPGGAG